MGDIQKKIEDHISSKKVFIISKSYCPFCTKAKKIFEEKYLKTGILSSDDYMVLDIENDPNCDKIQEFMSKLTGARSVPRVFINGKCIGGGDETAQLESQGKLKALLQ
ncbi:hypothetical protein LOTGIDRAFT_234601 [Lottia gigantea]|uniref:Glutaredoxin domain-containing protein n=1 Tax=Lottia gigantea TaxID=225164 RepID=V3ZB76_LOTGI|nr:hypothetical protein LOTGIDRAFT_234601 [Lottia gigantea]ESO88268.1 hypothetical protein LOTGIDRAFT_234601 [Lottia gigantea]